VNSKKDVNHNKKKKKACKTCGKTPDAHMGLSGYLMVVPDHDFAK